jgi:hypothetical protein
MKGSTTETASDHHAPVSQTDVCAPRRSGTHRKIGMRRAHDRIFVKLCVNNFGKIGWESGFRVLEPVADIGPTH